MDITTALAQLRQWAATGQPPCADAPSLGTHIVNDVAPLAEQLGLSREQHELQDLAIQLGYPDDYRRLKQLLLDSEMSCQMVFHTFTLPIRNWITHPKPSGYQALQLTVMGPDCNWVELQIRSERMDYEAEHGKAAHWLYKQESKAM